MGDFGNYGMGGGGGNDFGNNGGGGGGGSGFMQSGGDFGNMQASQGSQGQGGDAAIKLATLTPTSIRMLVTAEQSPDETFVVDGGPVSRVTFYGKVLDVESKATNMRYVLDDGSGTIEVTKWTDMDSGGGMLQMSPITAGNYVCVEGQIRSFNGKTQINAANIRVIHDMNEFTHHLLEIISVHVQSHKGPLNPALRPAPQQQQQQQQQQQMQPQHSSVMGGGNNNNNQNQNQNYGAQPIQIDNNMGGGGGGGPAGLDPITQMVMNAFNGESETGRSVMEAAGMLQQQGITQQQVEEAVNALANEGHLYSTIDENHYKSTAC